MQSTPKLAQPRAENPDALSQLNNPSLWGLPWHGHDSPSPPPPRPDLKFGKPPLRPRGHLDQRLAKFIFFRPAARLLVGGRKHPQLSPRHILLPRNDPPKMLEFSVKRYADIRVELRKTKGADDPERGVASRVKVILKSGVCWRGVFWKTV